MTAEPYTAAPDANDILMGGGGAPTAKFSNPGDTVGGRIVAPPKSHQEREYDRNNPGKGRPKTFPSGDPIYGLTIDVQTQQRDPMLEDDDGVRRIYVEGKRLKEAVRDAVRTAGGSKLEVGGELYVTFTGNGEASGPGINPPKLYAARYVPAAQAVVFGQQPAQQPQAAYAQQQPAAYAQTPQGQVNTSTGELAPQQQPTAQAQPPVAPPPQAPAAPAGPTPEAIAALRAAGVDPATVYPGFQG